jgi:transcriptional regulator of aromatic amino acid metabolism
MTKREAMEQARRIVVALIEDYMISSDELAEMSPEDQAKLCGFLSEIRDRLRRLCLS